MEHDVDRQDVGNPLCSTEYIESVVSHWKASQERHQQLLRAGGCGYDRQPQITLQHRATLIDWMADVCQKLELLSETLFLSVQILDRFVGVKAIAKDRLQLVGLVCLWLACKYEDPVVPAAKALVSITANAYTTSELILGESLVLQTLQFSLYNVTSLQYLRRYSRVSGADPKLHTLARYLGELCLLDGRLPHVEASKTAAATLWLARRMLALPEAWTSVLEKHSGYAEHELRELATSNIAPLVTGAQLPSNKLSSIPRRFSQDFLFCVANIPLRL